MNKNFKDMFIVAFTLAGSVIGAGILGLPYVFSQSGYFVGLFWIFFLGIFLIYCKLCLGEITLRTKDKHQIEGYADKYLGSFFGKIAFLSMMFAIYSALLAYLIGEGQSFSQLFFGSIDYSIYFGIGFWFTMTFLLSEGLRGLRKVETFGVIGIVLIVMAIFFFFVPSVSLDNITYVNTNNFFLPFGVTLFALLGFVAIPEMRREIGKNTSYLKNSIIIGSLISVIIYILFSFSFVGVFGRNVSEVATLSSNKFLILLGIFTMMTSYFVSSFALKDMFKFDFHESKIKRFFFVSFVPLVLYVLVSFFDLGSFISVLSIAGVVFGGSLGILILFTNLKSKKLGDRKPEYSMPMNLGLAIFISLLFLSAIIFQLFF